MISEALIVYNELKLKFKPVADIAYAPLQKIADATGKPLDESMLGLCLILNIILCLIISHIHSPKIRRVYSLSLGLFMSIYTFGGSCILLVPYNMIAFLFMSVFPRKY